LSKVLAEVVANCPNPKCDKPIRVDHVYSWCTECGEPLPKAIKAQLPRVRETSERDSAAQVVSEESAGSDSLARRYRDAYHSARIIVSAGNGTKIVGPLLAGVFAIASFKEGGYLLFGGLAFALALGTSLYIAGVLISAQGQLLQANIDSAVNTSPLLDNDQKSKILFS
jgi:hypothetical protein